MLQKLIEYLSKKVLFLTMLLFMVLGGSAAAQDPGEATFYKKQGNQFIEIKVPKVGATQKVTMYPTDTLYFAVYKDFTNWNYKHILRDVIAIESGNEITYSYENPDYRLYKIVPKKTGTDTVTFYSYYRSSTWYPTGIKNTIAIEVKVIEPLVVTVSSNQQYLNTPSPYLYISGGEAPYTVQSSDATTAITRVNDRTYKVEGKKPGETILTITDQSGQKIQRSITFKKADPITAFLSNPNPTLPVTVPPVLTIQGGVAPYTVRPSDSFLKVKRQSESTYTVMKNTLGKSFVYITDSIGQNYTLSVEFKKEEPKITSISSNVPREVTVKPNGTVAIDLLAYYSDRTIKKVTEQAVWTSKNPSVATVTNGKISAKTEGTTTVTWKYQDKSGSIKINVVIPVSKLTFQDPSTVVISSFSLYQLQLIATFANGSEKDVTELANWSYRGSSIEVYKGKVTSTLGTGKGTIIAEYQGLTKTVNYIVRKPYLK